MKISVCYIAKNEEKNLPLSLETVQPFADELIVADRATLERTDRRSDVIRVLIRKYRIDVADGALGVDRGTVRRRIALNGEEQLRALHRFRNRHVHSPPFAPIHDERKNKYNIRSKKILKNFSKRY